MAYSTVYGEYGECSSRVSEIRLHVHTHLVCLIRPASGPGAAQIAGQVQSSKTKKKKSTDQNEPLGPAWV